MLDDLLELAFDLAVELGGAASGQKKEPKKKPKTSASRTSSWTQKSGKSFWEKGMDPWDIPQRKPPWEK